MHWRYLSWMPALVWSGALYRLLTMEVDVEPKPWMFPHLDKVIHFGFFALFAWLLYWPLAWQGRVPAWRAAWLSFWLATVYGGWMEYVQSTLAHRQGSWADVIANAVGAATVFGAIRAWPLLLDLLQCRQARDHIAA